jgi:hypothetical protein
MNPAYERYGVGTALSAHSVADALASGAREYDWLRGGREDKRRWQVAERPLVHIVVAKPERLSRLAAGLSRGSLLLFQEVLRTGWTGPTRGGGVLRSWSNHIGPRLVHAGLRLVARAAMDRIRALRQ